MAEATEQPTATDNPVNVSDATEGQQVQAAQEIEKDPSVQDEPGAPEPGPYDDESVWTFRKLQAEIKERNADREDDAKISGQGTREELVARLTEDDGKSASPGTDPNAGVENGGIVRDVEISGTHADVLQSLSDARKSAQLKAVSEAAQS